ncbi:tyrosine-type recombinase/integrase [Rhizobium hidalgonense]|uniref:tyrosine-type recombinase/integrase n=1 Tax=Rhizobium hidalgonense TaxID=1538159 RepID=UPI0013E39C6C|nr:site-specific integrase [Rhizobium hidalgonense]
MKLTKKVVEAMEAQAADRFYWDESPKGFGVKVTGKGKKVFVVQTRLNGRTRRATIGEYGSPWSVDQAREEALSLLSQFARGRDPVLEKKAARVRGITVRELSERYWDEANQHKKSSTLDVERGLMKRHILPLLGERVVSELTTSDVQQFHQRVAKGDTAVDEKTKARGRAIVKGGKGTSNRTLDLLSSMLSFAVDVDARPDNPARSVKKFKLKTHDRQLTEEELGRLGEALAALATSGVSEYAIGALRFLALTGCRRGEALSLQWSWIDKRHGIAKLPDSKTGQKVLVLGEAALLLLDGIPRRADSLLVFPSSAGGTTPISIQKIWRKVCKLAAISEIRLHDLRHNFASEAVSSGQSLYIVGKLLGHNQQQTTQRYAHLAANPVKAAADATSSSMARQMLGKVPAPKQ